MMVVFSIVACNQTPDSQLTSVAQVATQTNTLNIWWDKGFNPEEDEALRQLVRNWEQKTNNKIKIVFYTTDSLGEKIRRAIQAGNPPDIVMSFKAERSPNSRLAWENKLVDVSDIIEPVKNLYSSDVLKTVNFYNNVAKKRSFYAIPLYQGTIHIYYWRDLLKEVGRTDKDIPKEWDAFWEFWKKVQDDLRAKQKSKIYSLGLTLSSEAGDTYYLFEQILEAYDVKIISANGQLLIDDPQVRQGIIKVLKWYQKFYQQGYIPPEALKWLNPDNNRSLLNRLIVMTPNATASIPAAVRQNSDTYRNKLGIIEFPNKPNGQPMQHLTMAEQAVVLAESKNQALAKEFLRYLVQPQVMKNYLKAAGGRNSPVLQPVWQDNFWTNPNDPHISTVTKTITKGKIRYFYISQNPIYSRVLDENVWGIALNRVIVDKITPEQATDEAIKQIKQIYQEWGVGSGE
jgi:multiple sugar transport system substrate-binding protein